MLPITSLRALPAGRPLTRLRAVRFSSHDAPQYNEPTGLLFGEKVRRPDANSHSPDWTPFPASSARAPQNKAALGDYLVLGNVRLDGGWRRVALLQAGYEVRLLL